MYKKVAATAVLTTALALSATSAGALTDHTGYAATAGVAPTTRLYIAGGVSATAAVNITKVTTTVDLTHHYVKIVATSPKSYSTSKRWVASFNLLGYTGTSSSTWVEANLSVSDATFQSFYKTQTGKALDALTYEHVNSAGAWTTAVHCTGGTIAVSAGTIVATIPFGCLGNRARARFVRYNSTSFGVVEADTFPASGSATSEVLTIPQNNAAPAFVL